MDDEFGADWQESASEHEAEGASEHEDEDASEYGDGVNELRFSSNGHQSCAAADDES